MSKEMKLMSKQQHTETNPTLISMGISNRIQGVHTRNTRAGDGGGNPYKLRNNFSNSEEWRPIKDYPKYMVSNFGRVKSIYRILKLAKNKAGYLVVNLSKNGKTKIHFVHLLVWDSFRNNRGKYSVDHIDGNTSNSFLDNLQLLTHRDNIIKGYRAKRELPTGVTKVGRKFISQIYIDKTRYWLGSFNSISEAESAYLQKYSICPK